MFHPVSGCKRNFLTYKKYFAFFHRKLMAVQLFPQRKHLIHNILRLLIFQHNPSGIPFYTFHRCSHRKNCQWISHGNDLRSCIGKGLRPHGRNQEHINILFQRKPWDLLSGISSCLWKYRTVNFFIRCTDQSQTDIQIFFFNISCKCFHNLQTFFITENTDQANVKSFCGFSDFFHCRKIMWGMRNYM